MKDIDNDTYAKSFIDKEKDGPLVSDVNVLKLVEDHSRLKLELLNRQYLAALSNLTELAIDIAKVKLIHDVEEALRNA